jgi:hypothetical protein
MPSTLHQKTALWTALLTAPSTLEPPNRKPLSPGKRKSLKSSDQAGIKKRKMIEDVIDVDSLPPSTSMSIFSPKQVEWVTRAVTTTIARARDDGIASGPTGICSLSRVLLRILRTERGRSVAINIQ